MSNPRHSLPTIINAHAPFERLSERARRVAELSDLFGQLIRQVDAISPTEAANLYVLGGRVAVLAIAGIKQEVES